jgi:hypothetical protein
LEGKVSLPLSSYGQAAKSDNLQEVLHHEKKKCHLISSDITQLWLQLQSYSIPTLNLILVFLMSILKKISKKLASAQLSLQLSSACSVVQLIANFCAVQGSGWPGAWH